MANSPIQLWGIDFVGPFPQIPGVPWRHILIIVDYFSRFVWAYPSHTDDQDEVIRVLTDLFEREGEPIGIYADAGPHFGARTQAFAQHHGVIWTASPSAAKRSTGIVEKANDLFQRVLKKSGDPHQYHLHITKATHELNRRELPHLGYSPFDIHRGYQPAGKLASTDT